MRKKKKKLDLISSRAEALKHSMISRLGACKGFVLVFWRRGLPHWAKASMTEKSSSTGVQVDGP